MIATHRAAGVTLVEMLIVLVITGVVLAALLVNQLMSYTLQVSAQAYVQVQQEVRRAFDSMVKELQEAGQVNDNVSIADVQQLDFQVVRNYDAVACAGTAGICWGSEALLNGWVHYVLDAADPQRARLMRCVTVNRLDPMPANFAGCRVFANHVSSNPASSSFTYDHANRVVTIKLQALITSQQLPGGSIQAAPSPLVWRVVLRNTL